MKNFQNYSQSGCSLSAKFIMTLATIRQGQKMLNGNQFTGNDAKM